EGALEREDPDRMLPWIRVRRVFGRTFKSAEQADVRRELEALLPAVEASGNQAALAEALLDVAKLTFFDGQAAEALPLLARAGLEAERAGNTNVVQECAEWELNM